MKWYHVYLDSGMASPRGGKRVGPIVQKIDSEKIYYNPENGIILHKYFVADRIESYHVSKLPGNFSGVWFFAGEKAQALDEILSSGVPKEPCPVVELKLRKKVKK